MNSFAELSIIIPVGPNEQSWRVLLNDLSNFSSNIEIIISACQQAPREYQLPKNVKWILATQGRASQLNAGAAKSTRNILWFLHADSRFTRHISKAIQTYSKQNTQCIGYFKLKFAKDGPRLAQVNAWAANIRSRYFKLPFGDQGFIMHKAVFDQLKGFDQSLKLGEDLDFVIRAKSAGILLQEIPCQLLSSARRYQQYGWLSTTIRFVWLTWLLSRQARQRLLLN